MTCGQAALLALEANADDAELIEHGPLLLDIDVNAMADGESHLFHYPNNHSPCILVKVGEDNIHAYSQKCTHLACPVIPKPEQDMLYCPCHNGAFDLETGAPLFGPPKTPLPRVVFKINDNGSIMVQGMEYSS